MCRRWLKQFWEKYYDLWPDQQPKNREGQLCHQY